MQDREDSHTSCVTHLECAKTGESHDAGKGHGLARAGAPLLVRYDLAALSQALQKKHLALRQPDLWRYREMLPVNNPENIVSLGETMTPLLTASRMGDNVFI